MFNFTQKQASKQLQQKKPIKAVSSGHVVVTDEITHFKVNGNYKTERSEVRIAFEPPERPNMPAWNVYKYIRFDWQLIESYHDKENAMRKAKEIL